MANRDADYHTLTEIPEWTQAVFGPDGLPTNRDESDYLWSGKQAPPPMGALVKVSMNGLGAGTVVGYFAEYGWFGLLVRLDDPPAWLVRQNKANSPSHIFGADLS